MIKLILSGCGGRMGRTILRLCEEDPNLLVVAGIDPMASQDDFPFPVFSTPSDCAVAADVLVDFSSPAALNGLLALSKVASLPLVLASTGYDNAQLQAIQTAAQSAAIFRSANLSLGVNLLLELTRRAAQVLGDDFDIEIVERHHNKKLDAPSGTALMLADAIAQTRAESEYVYDRHSVRRERQPEEIGIHSVRGGTIVGEHEVIFAGPDEVIRISHSAYSRDVFATGAVRAALFAADAAPGLYSMTDMLNQGE